MHFHTVAALAASISFASAQRGFNSGNLDLAGNAKSEDNFLAEFRNQRLLEGTNGAFTSARLYTMIQGGTTNSPISAIPAAKETNTKLLLGLWASGGASAFANEIAALKSAIQQYGSYLPGLVTGISVGSEDLYRVTKIGQENDPGSVGAGPAELTDYINQVRQIINASPLKGTPIGHVDTWTSWVNGSNSAVADACDFVGMNGFPYFQTQNFNPIEQGGNLLYKAISDTKAHVGGKPVWVTETGYPTTGPKSGEAIASTANARSYWKQVYCTMPAGTPLFWYDQSKDNVGDAANFGVTGATLSPTPLYDLSCDDITSSSSKASSASHSATSAHSASSSTATGSGIKGPNGLVGGSGSGSESGSEGEASATASASGSEATATGKSGSNGSGSGSDNEATATASASAIEATASGKAGSNGSGSGSSAVGSAGVGGAAYPTAAPSGMSTVGVAAGSGTGGLPAPTSTLSPYSGNSASGVRSTLALLALPAIVALML